MKIQDKESREDPYVTIWFKLKGRWRLKLRDGDCMDDGSWAEIDEGVRALIEANWDVLCQEWDRRYGDVNPISSKDDGDE